MKTLNEEHFNLVKHSMRNMKRRTLELADAAFHASHGPKLLSSCPLCFGIARRSLQEKSKVYEYRLPPGKRDTTPTAPLKLPPLNSKMNTKRNESKIPRNASKTTVKGKGLKIHGNVVDPVKEKSLEDEISRRELDYRSSVGKGLKIHGTIVAPVEEESLEDEICRRELDYRSSVGKGLKIHGTAVTPIKEESLEDEISRSELDYRSSVVNSRSTDADLLTTDSVNGGLYRENENIATQILRQCLMEICSIDWETNIDGLMKITDMLRYSPHIVSESGCLPSVVRSLSCLLGSKRPKLCIAACRTSCTVFKRVPYTQRPEFNNLVAALLVKSCDNNRFVRQEADRALDAMAAYVPACNGVLALLEQEGRHSNVEVRSVTARTLDLVVEYQGPEALLDSKETRVKLWPALASFVDDVFPATRDYARHMCKSLAHDPRFARLPLGWQHRLERCPPQLWERLCRYAYRDGSSP